MRVAFCSLGAVKFFVRHRYADRKICNRYRFYSSAQNVTPKPLNTEECDDERWMRVAIEEARAAAERAEVPVGAVVVRDGVELARASNRVEQLRDVTQHAEIAAIRAASIATGGWRLIGATLYSTLEPCPMCLSAAALARVKRVVYGANDKRLGACGTWCELHTKTHPYHMFDNVTGGVLSEESEILMRSFFRRRRKENKLATNPVQL